MFDDECPGSKEIREPQPEEISCRHCGSEIEIWSDENEVRCRSCRKTTTRMIDSDCLNWCTFAKECVGEDRFRKIQAASGSKN